MGAQTMGISVEIQRHYFSRYICTGDCCICLMTLERIYSLHFQV